MKVNQNIESFNVNLGQFFYKVDFTIFMHCLTLAQGSSLHRDLDIGFFQFSVRTDVGMYVINSSD